MTIVDYFTNRSARCAFGPIRVGALDDIRGHADEITAAAKYIDDTYLEQAKREKGA